MKSKLNMLACAVMIWLTGILGVQAQDIFWSVGGQGMVNTMNIDGVEGTTNLGSGAGLMLDVGYKFSDKWSVNTGVGYSTFSNNVGLNQTSGRESTTDIEGENFDFIYQMDRYSEQQRFNTVTIPLTVQYETTGTTRFYARAGASMSLFSGSTQESRAVRLETSGFFPRFNGTLTAPAFAGFGTYNNIDFEEQDLEVDNSFNLIFETGAKQVLENGNAFYVGLFTEIGLNDITSDATAADGLLSYNSSSPTQFISNGVFAGDVSPGTQAVDQAKLFFVGLRLRYQWGGN